MGQPTVVVTPMAAHPAERGGPVLASGCRVPESAGLAVAEVFGGGRRLPDDDGTAPLQRLDLRIDAQPVGGGELKMFSLVARTVAYQSGELLEPASGLPDSRDLTQMAIQAMRSPCLVAGVARMRLVPQPLTVVGRPHRRRPTPRRHRSPPHSPRLRRPSPLDGTTSTHRMFVISNDDFSAPPAGVVLRQVPQKALHPS